MPTPLIIGHRGASAVAPENTMIAFCEAIAAGADGIEFDVRLTRDGVPVVIHDSTLRRTTGLPHRIADLTLPELENLNVGVPSLEQLFTLFESNELILNLEMKCDSPSEHAPLAEACCRLAGDYSLKQRLIISCFDLAALEAVNKIDSEIKTAALFQPAISKPSVWLDRRILDQAAGIGASALALHHTLARRQLIEKAKLAGLFIAVWTVGDPAWIERARLIGVDALITNNPAAMLAHR
ncbi:MAG TPA: glycerophosphodiester phosphodiesterase [Pyrinomonadaceae bacterium]